MLFVKFDFFVRATCCFCYFNNFLNLTKQHFYQLRWIVMFAHFLFIVININLAERAKVVVDMVDDVNQW